MIIESTPNAGDASQPDTMDLDFRQVIQPQEVMT